MCLLLHWTPALLNNLQTRGFINDCTDLVGLDDLLKRSKITCYIGYDATASSLHVGHLVNIMMLRWFQKCGGTPITLIGGGTTRVGDPSFRSEERPLLGINEIKNNQLKKSSEKTWLWLDSVVLSLCRLR